MAPRRSRRTRARVTLDLGEELTRRLRVHGIQTGRTDSVVVRELLERHLPRYVVQVRGPRTTSEDDVA